MRLHKILFSIPICVLYTGKKSDITEYWSVSTWSTLTVGLTFPSAFNIVLMLPGRLCKPSVQEKKKNYNNKAFLFLALFFTILQFLLCLHQNSIFSSLRTKPQLLHIFLLGFYEPICQEMMTFLVCGFWSWPGETIPYHERQIRSESLF